MSRAPLGVRRRYCDDVRLDSRYAKTGRQWCHVLVLASVVATATMSASSRVTLRQGGSGVEPSLLFHFPLNLAHMNDITNHR